jgi:hypothetical protein
LYYNNVILVKYIYNIHYLYNALEVQETMCDKEVYNYSFKPSKSREQRCCMFSKDKKYQIVWDINDIIDNPELLNFPIEQRNVMRLSEQDGGICTNPDYAMGTDTGKPCIIVKLNENVEIFIDGNHRLYKARQLNIENIPCYILPEEFYINFIIDYDENVYEKVIADYSPL